jgi:hypothetical protein
MQIKTTVGFHLTLFRIAIIKNTTNSSVGEDVGRKEPSCTMVGMKASVTILENNMEAS